MSQKQFSNNSDPIFSIKIPTVKDFSSEFVYNFYVSDESINEESGVPTAYKKKTIEKNDVDLPNFSLRVPRYVSLTWTSPKFKKPSNPIKAPAVSENLDKVAIENNFTSLKYVPYTFSSVQEIQNASIDINSSAIPDASQATVIDNFVNQLIKSYSENQDSANVEKLKSQIVTAVESIEKLGDNSEKNFGYKFYDFENKKINNISGFEKVINSNFSLNSQLNSLILNDIFKDSSLSQTSINDLNSRYTSAVGTNVDFSSPLIKPVIVGLESEPASLEQSNASKKVELIAYLIERYEYFNDSLKKTKTIVVENFSSSSVIDATVKYGTTYYYIIRTIAKITSQAVDSNNVLKDYTYYVASQPINTYILCDEDVPPPPPADLRFNWNYTKSKLQITWSMPFNSQRDIKQFQVFRRSSIHEPFELLKQQCFDFSSLKKTTGETVDGNSSGMDEQHGFFVSYEDYPSQLFVDEEFIADSENFISSKYIYCIASVDAHGYISNYSAQFEISFDFFKNKIIKKLISSPGAPRAYPNLLLNKDLFKDTIKVSGTSSTKMTVYFMPEYFKLKRNDKSKQKMVATIQDDSYYKIQFINLQNQKSESLKITIDDPFNLVGQ